MPKVVLSILIILFSPAILATENFELKVFTPSVVSDSRNEGAKGAVQLVWQRGQSHDQYEIQISNGSFVYSDVVNRHFKHVMLYFNKNYKWRIRKVNRERDSGFSQWFSVKVLKENSLIQSVGALQHSQAGELETLYVDTGGI